MTTTRRIAILAMIISLGSQTGTPLWGAGRSEVFYAHARVGEIISPVELKVQLLSGKRTVTVRLQGLSSPNAGQRVNSIPASYTPARQKNISAAATEFVKSTLAGKVVELWTRKGGWWDDKNRLLACVRVRNFLDEVVDVNGELVKRGLCLVSREYLHSTFARFKLLEEDAKRTRRGMWHVPESKKVSEADRAAGSRNQ